VVEEQIHRHVTTAAPPVEALQARLLVTFAIRPQFLLDPI
jgi:hypothetical protein